VEGWANPAERIRTFRNLIHPVHALRKGDLRKFTREQLEELKEMYDSLAHSLMYYL
jgi:hypothetical protein